MNGLILINKVSGSGSFQTLQDVKRKLGASKAGFLGTLDPLATGLLVCFFGTSTKLIRHFEEKEKTYEVTFELGKETDTLDSTGKVMATSEAWKDLGEEVVRQTILKLQGKMLQKTPAFSAVRREGKRAYNLARKEVIVDLGKREV